MFETHTGPKSDDVGPRTRERVLVVDRPLRLHRTSSSLLRLVRVSEGLNDERHPPRCVTVGQVLGAQRFRGAGESDIRDPSKAPLETRDRGDCLRCRGAFRPSSFGGEPSEIYPGRFFLCGLRCAHRLSGRRQVFIHGDGGGRTVGTVSGLVPSRSDVHFRALCSCFTPSLCDASRVFF
jgi:hypothetical protein